jgi:hypothetical protein
VAAAPSVLAGNGPSQSNWLNDMVTAMPVSLLWVPHHVSGLIASWVALLAIVDAFDARREGRPTRHVFGPAMLTAFGFASAFGLSVWLTFGLVFAVAIWSLMLLAERRTADVVLLVGVGCVSLMIAAPHIVDIVAGRSTDVSTPLAFKVRNFFLVEKLFEIIPATWPWSGFLRGLLNFILLPANYLYEMGFLAIAAVMFVWRSHRSRLAATDVGRLLVATGVAAFLLGSFVASVIVNNDLGWRVMLFAQVSALVWTAALVAPLWRRAAGRISAILALRVLPAPLRVAFAVGCAGVAFDVVALRLHAPLGMPLPNFKEARVPEIDHAVRRAFQWLRANADSTKIVQHNPDHHRAYGYALYGGHRVAVADREQPILFGSPIREVRARIDALSPLFTREHSGTAVAATAAAHNVDIIVVTSSDPVWRLAPTWLVKSPALYASAHVRVLSTNQIVP